MLTMRTFKISSEQALRLSNRASGCGKSSADLVREYIDKFINNPVIINASPHNTLRSFYLTKKQDQKLTELAIKFKVSKGLLFRIAIDKGLGTPQIME